MTDRLKQDIFPDESLRRVYREKAEQKAELDRQANAWLQKVFGPDATYEEFYRLLDKLKEERRLNERH